MDRELSPEEEGTFHRILSESAEARRLLREMESIRSAARRVPALTVPPPQVESRLFQQLFAEETEETEEQEQEDSADRKPVPLFARISATARRSGMFAAAAMVVALIGWGSFRIAGNSDGAAGDAVAAAMAPSGTAARPSGAAEQKTANASAAARIDAGTARSEEIQTEEKNETIGRRSGATIGGAVAPRSSIHSIHREEIAPPAKVEAVEDAPNGTLPFAVTDPASETAMPEVDSWPPRSLNLQTLAAAENNALANSGRNADVQPQELSDPDVAPARSPLTYAAAPSRKDESQTISASYRHGLSYLENSGSEFTTQDFSLRVEGRFDNRHRLSLAVGQSPLLVERTARTMPTGIAVNPDGKGPGISSAEQVEHFSRVADEVWAGIGYGYALVAAERLRLEPGINFGVGERSLRISAELPIRYRLTDRFSLDLVASVSRVQPHDQITRDVDREYDRDSFLHVDEEQHPVFTSVGASIGLSFDLGR